MHNSKILAFTLFFILSGLFTSVQAQEMFCRVSVSAPQLQSDRQIYTDLQKAIQEYLNFRSWTQNKFDATERINVRMNIIISERPAIDYFKGTLQLQITRPVYNSTYETQILNIKDKNFDIKFVPFQTLEFSDVSYIDNLTAILNYYAYIILGMDYDTFQLYGGNEYFGMAANMVSMAQNSRESGWKSFDGGNKSRYWLSQNLNSTSYKKVRAANYTFHRQGLDLMEKDPQKARTNILGALKEVQKVNIQNPNTYLIRIFIETKSAEIKKVFLNAMPHEKNQLIAIMENLDPSGLNEYRQILSN